MTEVLKEAEANQIMKLKKQAEARAITSSSSSSSSSSTTTTTATASPLDNELWVDKYSPQSFTQVEIHTSS
jgi:hypothetical protein